MKKVLMIVGSFRKNSFNHQLAKQAEQMLEGKADVSFLEFSDLSFMNQDVEFPPPKSVARAKRKMRPAVSARKKTAASVRKSRPDAKPKCTTVTWTA